MGELYQKANHLGVRRLIFWYNEEKFPRGGFGESEDAEAGIGNW